MSERVYVEEADLYDLDIPNGWIVGRDDVGRIYMEEDDSGGSPGSWPIDDEESGEDEVDDVSPDAGDADDRRRIGQRMLDVAEFVRANPGACKAEVRRGVGLYPKPYGYAVTPLERAEQAGLVYSFKTVSGRVRFYPAGYDTTGPADSWTPAHP